MANTPYYFNNGTFEPMLGGLDVDIAAMDGDLTAMDVRLEGVEEDIALPTTGIVTLSKTTQVDKEIGCYAGIADVVLKGDTLFNGMPNGNGASGTTGLIGTAGVVSTDANSILLTGDGGSVLSRFYTQTKISSKAGNKVFVKATCSVSNAVCASIEVGITDSTLTAMSQFSQKVLTPTQDVSYPTFGVVTLDAGYVGDLRVVIGHRYADAASSNGKVLKINKNTGIMLIPITGTPYENMTADEINSKIGAYFEGLKGATLATVGGRGKNIAGSASDWESGSAVGTLGLTYEAAKIVSSLRLRSKNLIPVAPNSSKVLSWQAGYEAYIYQYDGNKSLLQISPSWQTTNAGVAITVLANARYLVLIFRKTGDTALTLDDIALIRPQLEEGAVATAYTPFDGSQVSISAVRHKLPNLVEDTFEFIDGRWLFYKRTAEYTLLSADITANFTGTNMMYWGISIASLPGSKAFTTNSLGQVLHSKYPEMDANWDAVARLNTCFVFDSTPDYLLFVYAKATAQATAQADLAGTKVIYQLDTPLIIEEKDFNAYGITIDGRLSSNTGDTEFYAYSPDIFADVAITYPMNIGEGTKSLAKNVEQVQSKLAKRGGILESYAEKKAANVSATGTVTLDLSLQNIFEFTLAGATTFVLSNVPAAGLACSVTLVIRQGATPYAVTYPAGVKWSNDVIGDISTANKTSVVTMVTFDGGVRWYAFLAGNKFTT